MQTKEAINTIPIQKFIQQVKIADSGQHKEIRMNIQEAKNLMFSLLKYLVPPLLLVDIPSTLYLFVLGSNESQYLILCSSI